MGHVARMADDCILKRILFGWLPQTRPAHGVKLRWRDKVKQTLRAFPSATRHGTIKLKTDVYGNN